MFRCATEVEGHPDNAAPATYGGLMLAAHQPVPLTFHSGLGCALAVPESGIDTHQARRILPGDVSRATAIAQASRAAALVIGLTSGDGELIAYGMQDQLAVDYRKHLIPGFDAAVKAGHAAGAYGVTISGAGSSLFGVTPRGAEATVATAMASALTDAGNRAVPIMSVVSTRGLTQS